MATGDKRFNPFLIGTVKDGRLRFNEPERLSLLLSDYEGQEVQVTVEKRVHKRSNKQNAYYWGVVIKMLGDYFGYLPDEMHSALKLKFLLKEMKPDGPLVVGDTKDLTTDGWEEYMANVRMWANRDYHILIPLPNEGVWS